MGLLDMIASIWRGTSKEPTIQTETAERPDATPLTHATEAVNEVEYIYQQMSVESGRRAILRDVERMLEEDPFVDESNDFMAAAAVRGGIYVLVTGSSSHLQRKARKTGAKAGRGSKVANQAQEIIDAFMKRCKIDSNAYMWFSRVIADGDLFLNIVVEQEDSQPYISAIRRSPPAIMKRNEDQFGQFIDLNRAFSEIDPKTGVYTATVIPENAIRHFPIWGINHIRYRWRGGLYGRSKYASIRKLSRQNASADDDIVVRRKTRAPQRRVHSIGTKDTPASEPTVTKYRNEHKDAIVNGRYKPTTDYYNNGQGDVKNLDGDGNLDKIADVTYLNNKQNIGTSVPKGLIGFAEDINRDVLDRQTEVLHEKIEDLRHLMEYGDGGEFSGLRAIIDFELLLHGIDLEAAGLGYDVVWSPLDQEDAEKAVNSTKAARDANMISQRTAIVRVAHHFDVEDPEAEMQAIEEERKGKAEAQPKGVDPNAEEDPPGAVTDAVKGGEHKHDDIDGEEHLDGMDEIMAAVLALWQKRFERLNESRAEIALPTLPKSINGSVKLSQKDIDAYLKAIAKMHKGDREKFIEDIMAEYHNSFEKGGTVAAALVGLNYAKQHEVIIEEAADQILSRLEAIDGTTEKQLHDALVAEFESSGNEQEVLERVEEAVDDVYINGYTVRAEQIAVSEPMWAYNHAALQVFETAGINTTNAPMLPLHVNCRCTYSVKDGKIVIIVTVDERTCPKCKEYVGKKY